MLRYQRRFDATGNGLQRLERIDVMAQQRQVKLCLLRKLRINPRPVLSLLFETPLEEWIAHRVRQYLVDDECADVKVILCQMVNPLPRLGNRQKFRHQNENKHSAGSQPQYSAIAGPTIGAAPATDVK